LQAKLLTQGFPDLIGDSQRLYTRNQAIQVPQNPPYRVQLPADVVEDSLLVETGDSDLMDRDRIPLASGVFSYHPTGSYLEFHEDDAGKQLNVSYAFGPDGRQAKTGPMEMGLIMVFPLLGRTPNQGIRVLEAKRAVISEYQEELSWGQELVASVRFVLLADQAGYLLRQRLWEPEE